MLILVLQVHFMNCCCTPTFFWQISHFDCNCAKYLGYVVAYMVYVPGFTKSQKRKCSVFGIETPKSVCHPEMP